MSETRPRFSARRLAWQDVSLGSVALPGGRTMPLTLGLGSGLSRCPREPDVLWAIGDRGPNLKIKTAMQRYGMKHLRHLREIDGAKIMPRPDLGPTLCKLKLHVDRITLLERMPLHSASGRVMSGLPILSDVPDVEPAFDIDGNPLGSDPCGADTEAIAALSDGGFWIGDEYGPSLLRVDATGRVLRRWVPHGLEAALATIDIAVEPRLPALALKRRINRGFEALAVSTDERWLYLAFQSPLAHPDVAAFERARCVRIWKLDAVTGSLLGQFAYPLDAPSTFERDLAHGNVDRSDVKVSEIAVTGDDRLLVLERISLTTKLYEVTLSPQHALPAAHMDERTRPTLEQLSAETGFERGLPMLTKRLVLSTDTAASKDGEMMDADMEGLVVLSPNELLLVTDNDFGVEGASTHVWHVTLDDPLPV